MRTRAIALIIVLSIGIWNFSNSVIVQAAGSATVNLGDVEEMTVGESLELDIFVDPNGESLDTVRVNLSFPADLVQVDYFTLGDQFPRSSPGNKVDNTTGLISEGGFVLSGPVTEQGKFGTVVFKAIKAGKATIKVLETSRLISGGEEKINTSSLAEKKLMIVEPEAVVPGAVTVSVSSLSHSDQSQWFNINDATFSWSASGEVSGYEMVFDQNPNIEPSKTINSTSVTIKDVADGVWYLHLRGLLAEGEKTETVHYKIMIDTVSPNKFEPTLDKEQLSEGEDLTLTFGTTDELSGMAKYEVSINGNDFLEDTSPVVLEDLKAGNYFIEVKAVDLAGNKIYGRAVARVYPVGVELPPVIAATPISEEGAMGESPQDNRTVLWGGGIGGAVLIGLLILLKRRKNKFKKI